MRKAAASKATSTKKKALKDNDTIVLRIPKLSFKDNSLNIYLGILLIIFSFILGMLTNKVLFLEKQFKQVTDAQIAAAPQVSPTAVPLPQYEKVDNGHLPIKGKSNAKVTIVEFSDFQCPFCKQYIDQTDSQIQDQYVKTGKAKFVYRHFPLTSIHPNAQKAAEASECANEQSQFWAYHDLLYKNQDTWSPLTSDDAASSFVDYAGQLGMDTDQFKTCLDTDKYKDNVDKDAAAGDKAQVDGTPAFFINGYRLTGAQPFSEFQKVIDADLKK